MAKRKIAESNPLVADLNVAAMSGDQAHDVLQAALDYRWGQLFDDPEVVVDDFTPMLSDEAWMGDLELRSREASKGKGKARSAFAEISERLFNTLIEPAGVKVVLQSVQDEETSNGR